MSKRIEMENKMKDVQDLNDDFENKIDLSSLNTYEELENFFESLDSDDLEKYDQDDLENAAGRYASYYSDNDDREMQKVLDDFLERASKSKSIKEYITQVKRFRTEFVHLFQSQLYETYGRTNEIYDAIEYNPGVGGYCFGDYCYSVEQDTRKQLENAFFKYFFDSLRTFCISCDDLRYCERLEWFKFQFNVDFDGLSYERSFKGYYDDDEDEEDDEVDEDYEDDDYEDEETQDEDKEDIQNKDQELPKKLDSQNFNEFRNNLCNALKLNVVEFDEVLNMNLALLKFDLKFDLNEEQKAELRSLLQNSKSAQNILKRILENNLDDQYDFESLRNLLSKDENKRKLKLNI